jgi:hypothetical protein
MESQSERLEREAEETLWQLSSTLAELRGRMTPGRVLDQVIDSTRESPTTDFLRNLGREVRENPLPLVLVGIGILWLLLASNRTSRAVIASAADQVTAKAEDFGAATRAAVSKTTEWGQQVAARLRDPPNDAANTVGNAAGELADRAHDGTGKLAEKARSAATGAVTTVERAERSLTGASAGAAAPMSSGPAGSNMA